MSKVLDALKQLELPSGQYVVIGSGLLDVYGLRESSDVDLAVSEQLFDELKQRLNVPVKTRDGMPYLEYGVFEIWLGWYSDMPFSSLKETAVTVDGVLFAHPEIIIQRKRERGLSKDMADIELLKEYLAHGTDK